MCVSVCVSVCVCVCMRESVCVCQCVSVCVSVCVPPHLVRVDDLLPQEGVLPGPAAKQAPVHPQVPDERVQRADSREDDEQVQEHVAV